MSWDRNDLVDVKEEGSRDWGAEGARYDVIAGIRCSPGRRRRTKVCSDAPSSMKTIIVVYLNRLCSLFAYIHHISLFMHARMSSGQTYAVLARTSQPVLEKKHNFYCCATSTPAWSPSTTACMT
jgi:hypothetical protein